jgi:hypothetical protein
VEILCPSETSHIYKKVHTTLGGQYVYMTSV